MWCPFVFKKLSVTEESRGKKERTPNLYLKLHWQQQEEEEEDADVL